MEVLQAVEEGIQSQGNLPPQWCRFLAFDTEARGPNAVDARLESTELTHCSWWNERGEGEARPFHHSVCHKSWGTEPQWDTNSTVANAIRDSRVIKLFWNAKYDLKLMHRAGIEIKGPIIDVMLLARVVHTAERKGGYSLKSFARKYIGNTYQEETQLKKWVAKQKRADKPCAYGDAPLLTLHKYSLLDARCTFELFYLMREGLTPALAKLLCTEHEVLYATIQMENRGLLMDSALVVDLMHQCTMEMKRTKGALRRITGDPQFNPNSPKQLIRIFYKEMGRNPLGVTKTGTPSTDKVAMLMMRDKYQDERAQLVLDWRKVAKARNTYLKRFLRDRDKTGVLHGYFNQSGTRTGRFSSSSPNLQNITRPNPSPAGRLRDCFVCRPDFRFICIDYDQIELRLGAHFARVTGMLRAVHEGRDLHGDTARNMFCVTEAHARWEWFRQIAKTLNFAIFYGIGSEEFVNTLIRESETYISIYEAAKFRTRYKEIYPEIESYFTEIAEEVLKTGGVTNPFGRFMEVPSWKSYVGVNYKIQSTAADLIKQRMVRCCRTLMQRRKEESSLVAIVHDELIFELHYKDKGLIPTFKKIMEELTMFSVPMTCSVSIAQRWGSKRKLAI